MRLSINITIRPISTCSCTYSITISITL